MSTSFSIDPGKFELGKYNKVDLKSENGAAKISNEDIAILNKRDLEALVKDLDKIINNGKLTIEESEQIGIAKEIIEKYLEELSEIKWAE